MSWPLSRNTNIKRNDSDWQICSLIRYFPLQRKKVSHSGNRFTRRHLSQNLKVKIVRTTYTLRHNLKIKFYSKAIFCANGTDTVLLKSFIHYKQYFTLPDIMVYLVSTFQNLFTINIKVCGWWILLNITYNIEPEVYQRLVKMFPYDQTLI